MKKLSRPFQSLIHARRTYRELRLLKHLKHENVRGRASGAGIEQPTLPGGGGSEVGGEGPLGARPLCGRGPKPVGRCLQLCCGPASVPCPGHRASGRLHAGHIHRGFQRSVSGLGRLGGGLGSLVREGVARHGPHSCPCCRYLVTTLMGADLNNIVKCQALSDEHVQFLVYQLLRGLKVGRVGSGVRSLDRVGLGQNGVEPGLTRSALPCSISTRQASSTG